MYKRQVLNLSNLYEQHWQIAWIVIGAGIMLLFGRKLAEIKTQYTPRSHAFDIPIEDNAGESNAVGMTSQIKIRQDLVKLELWESTRVGEVAFLAANRREIENARTNASGSLDVKNKDIRLTAHRVVSIANRLLGIIDASGQTGASSSPADAEKTNMSEERQAELKLSLIHI